MDGVSFNHYLLEWLGTQQWITERGLVREDFLEDWGGGQGDNGVEVWEVLNWKGGDSVTYFGN